MITTEPFDALAAHIKDAAKGRKIIFIPNPGNWGDGLIRYGTKAFFADYDIQHVEVNIAYSKGIVALAPFLIKPDKYFFIHGGGGAWCKAHNRAARTTGFITRVTKNIMVLPSTYEIAPSRSRGIYYVRDKFESAVAMPGSPFCHDMAFYLAHRGIPFRAPLRGPSANMFRTDKESCNPISALPADNIDMSTFGDHMSDCDKLLRNVAQYANINTDRLHLSIAGALVGSNVMLHVGNYFKIAAIYKSSMAEYFPSEITSVNF